MKESKREGEIGGEQVGRGERERREAWGGRRGGGVAKRGILGLRTEDEKARDQGPGTIPLSDQRPDRLPPDHLSGSSRECPGRN